ncbi:PGF-CTERM sorting domain-containing protein [Natrinema zhouii]|nr:PGF-CTERM sorting domain-containing protein [Natrinema zhouii]QLK27382.2 PGF-CTERM sorting domain-containing protein [Natrinema zhouii]
MAIRSANGDADDSDGDDSDDSDDSVPGFGAGAALVALLIGAASRIRQ